MAWGSDISTAQQLGCSRRRRGCIIGGLPRARPLRMYITYAVRLFWVDVPQRQGEILRRRLSRRRAQPQSQSSETKKKLKDIYIYIYFPICSDSGASPSPMHKRTQGENFLRPAFFSTLCDLPFGSMMMIHNPGPPGKNAEARSVCHDVRHAP
jgi:hypothetical protein